MAVNSEPKLISGNANIPLAKAVARRMSLHRGVGVELVKARVERFNDQEIFVEVFENVRGEDMFVIQSTSKPANDTLMELLIITDALRRSSARRITAVIPYFGYARQDRRAKARTPISAKLVANLLTRAGIDRILTLDLHAAQIQGFFDIPVDNLYAAPVFALDLEHHFNGRMGEMTVVSPDVGGVARARELAQRIGSGLAIVDKRRAKAGEIAEMTVIGDVQGQCCVIVDDICDTAGTLCKAAEVLMEAGAKEVHAYVTHGVMSGPAVERVDGLAAQEPRHHRLHRAARRGPQGAQHPHRAHRADVRAGDPEHLERDLGLVPVRGREPRADLRGHVRQGLRGQATLPVVVVPHRPDREPAGPDAGHPRVAPGAERRARSRPAVTSSARGRRGRWPVRHVPHGERDLDRRLRREALGEVDAVRATRAAPRRPTWGRRPRSPRTGRRRPGRRRPVAAEPLHAATLYPRRQPRPGVTGTGAKCRLGPARGTGAGPPAPWPAAGGRRSGRGRARGPRARPMWSPTATMSARSLAASSTGPGWFGIACAAVRPERASSTMRDGSRA